MLMLTNINKNTRHSSNRSNTLPHNNSLSHSRNSQSQSKYAPNNKGTSIISTKQALTPITQQNVIEKPYFLGKGNNHELIKKILSRRKGWGQVSYNESVLFRWMPYSQSFKYHTLGRQCICFNHFEYHRQLSNKQRLVQNLVNFCQANKINAYSFIPVTYILDLTTGQQDLALHSFLKFYNRNYPGQNINTNPTKKYQTVILPRNKYTAYLTAQQLNKRSQGNFYCKPYCPKTFVDEQSKAYLWVLKPTFLNRGRGVVLFRQLQQLQKIIWKYYEGEGLQDYCQKYQIIEKNQQESSEKPDSDEQKRQQSFKVWKKQEQPQKQEKKPEIPIQVQQSPKKQSIIENLVPTNNNKGPLPRCLSFIIQKYIQKPMLIENKKFDIRVWVLLNQNMQVFLFEEGYLRFSSQPYSTKNNHMNPFIHLTNNSVQKYCNQYDKTSGNQVAFSQLINYIPQSKRISIFNNIKAKIKEIVWLTMCSARRKININSRRQCFQLFGYDFMIDKDYKVWLIQVNTNPDIEESSLLLKMVLPRMIDDMFKLTIDRLFNSKMKDEVEPLPVKGYSDEENMWQYLGDLKEGANDRNNGKRLIFARR